MCKKIFRKFMVINLMLIMLLLNFTFLNSNEVIATAEEGYFTVDELPYNIKFTKVDSEDDSTLALDEEGNLWAWGENYGIYGTGTSTSSYTPIKIETPVKFAEISVGSFSAAAIDTEGNLWAWGYNYMGVVGNNEEHYSDGKLYTQTQITTGTRFVKIIVQDDTAIALDEEGNLWGWGDTAYGQLMSQEGNKTYLDLPYQNIPLKITSNKVYKDIDLENDSGNVVAAIDENDNLWMWGSNRYCQLGATRTAYVNDNGGYLSVTPVQIKSGTTFSMVSLGNESVFAIDTSGNLWGWGVAGERELGTYLLSNPYYEAEYKAIINPIKLGTEYSYIDSGPKFTVGIKTNGNVERWGKSYTKENSWLQNTDIGADNYKNYSKIISASGNIILFDSNGDLWMTGYNGYCMGIGIIDSAAIISLTQITGEKVYYTVTFKNGTDTVSTQTIERGKAATAPELTKEGYTLSWDKEFTNVTSDLTVNAIWTPNTNTAYKVEHYKQNISLNGYEKVETEEKTGTTDSLAVATKKTYEGFTENTTHSERLAQANVLADGSLVLKLYYDRNNYTVTLNANGGTINAGSISNYKYGVGATLPTNVIKQGYTFAGWHNNEQLTGNAVTSIGTSETGNKTYYAKWTASTNTAYKVEHYKQNTSLNGYEKADTENKTGTTGNQVTAVAKTYEGFTENTSHSERLAQANVLADGSLVLKLYYDRNNYTVTLNANGGTINAGSISNYKYGVGATLPTNVTKQGYTFAGWHNNEGLTGNAVTSIGTSETGNKTYYAKWTANTNTPYKVEHYLRTTDTEVEGYELSDTEEKTGTTDTTATAVAKTYEGFTENTSHRDRISTGNIEADGSLVLKLYYNRNSYNITYELNGGTASSELTSTYTYGKELILSNRVTKPGFEFAGWYDNEELSGEPVANIGTQETGNKNYYAKWTQNEFTVTFKNGEEIAKTQVVSKGESATAPNLTKEGYTLSWDKEFSNVTKDLTVNAVWTINKYTVIFKNEEETAKEETVSHGSNATAPELTKEGYTLSWDKAFNNITRDLTVNAVWTINQYTVTFKNGENVEKTETVNYGSGATAPSLTKVGYTLNWDKDFNNVTRDLTVNAVWTANTNTAYKVEHYLRTTDTEVEGYDLFETENKTGTTDEEVTAVAKEYEGFTENTSYKGRVPSGTVLADGSLVLKLYYNRNSYNITYELNGGTASTTLTNIYTYGKGLILSNRVTKQGYVFVGWYANSELTGETVTRIGTNETGNKTYYAKWVEEKHYYITSENHSINEDEKQITKVSPNTNVATFINNLDTNGTAKVLNLKGEEVAGDAVVGTGYKVQVDFNGTKYEYEIAVRGDLDGNGKVTITDLSTLNQILVDSLKVQGARKKAADIDYSNKITITDLSMMNQAIVGGKQL